MPLPKDITFVIGERDTADIASATINPLQPYKFGETIFDYDPRETQALAWIKAHCRRIPTPTHDFGHMETAGVPMTVKYIGADESSQATTGLTFDTGSTRLYKNMRLYFPRTKQIIRLTADPSGSNTGTVVRNDGTSGTPNLRKGDIALLLLTAKDEGAAMGKGITGGVVTKSFCTGIAEEPLEMTGTVAAERNVSGSLFDNELAKRMKILNQKAEADVIYGAKVEDDSSFTHPYHTSEGLVNWIKTNVWSLNGLLSRMDMWDILAEMKMFNKGGFGIITSPQLKQMITMWAMDKVVYDQNTRADGMRIDRLITPAGDFDFVPCDVLSLERNLMGTMLFIPLPYGRGEDFQGIDYRPLIGVENRDISYIPVVRAEYDLKEAKLFGEFGWEFWGEERFGMVSGVKF